MQEKDNEPISIAELVHSRCSDIVQKIVELDKKKKLTKEIHNQLLVEFNKLENLFLRSRHDGRETSNEDYGDIFSDIADE